MTLRSISRLVWLAVFALGGSLALAQTRAAPMRPAVSAKPSVPAHRSAVSRKRRRRGPRRTRTRAAVKLERYDPELVSLTPPALDLQPPLPGWMEDPLPDAELGRMGQTPPSGAAQAQSAPPR